MTEGTTKLQVREVFFRPGRVALFLALFSYYYGCRAECKHRL